MNSADIKIIIFDMDGVIVDSEPLHEAARQSMFVRYGIRIDESIGDPTGKSAVEYWAMIKDRYGLERAPKQLQQEQFSLVIKQIEEKRLPPSEGLLTVLERAKKKELKIGLASSSTRKLVNSTLGLLQVEGYFDFTVSGDEVPYRKPYPDAYQKVLDLSGFAAAQAIAVEDSITGIESAQRAGIYCVGYADNGMEHAAQKSDTMIRNLNELVSLLEL